MPRGEEDELDKMMASLGTGAKQQPAAPRQPAPAPAASDMPAAASASASTSAAARSGERAAPQPAAAAAPPQPAAAAPPPRGAGVPRLAWPPAHGGHAEQNARFRRYMEDELVAEPALLTTEKADFAFFGVYDGHGGRTAVEFASAQLHRGVAAELKATRGDDVPGAMRRAFMRCDAQLKPAGAYTSGTTAAVALLEQRADGGCVLHAANAGDSHCLLLRRGGGGGGGGGDSGSQPAGGGGGSALEAVRLTEEHSGKSSAETERVEAAGGTMSLGRVGGTLAVTRALGDHSIKEDRHGRGLTAEPFTAEPLNLDPRDSVGLLVVSDGVLEGIDDAECARVVQAALQQPPPPPPAGADEPPGGARGALADAVAKAVVDRAMAQGTRDNVSALLVLLEPSPAS